MISWVVVLAGRVVGAFTTTQQCGCSDPAWNLIRPPSWWKKIQFEPKKEWQKWEDWSAVQCISLLGRTGSYHCHKIVAYHSSKMFAKALRIRVSLFWLQSCVQLPCVNNFEAYYATGSWLQFYCKSTHACPATAYNFVVTFTNGPGAILWGISALWPGGGQTFLSEEHLKEFANAYSIAQNNLKHEIVLAKDLYRKKSQLPISLKQFISFIAPCKAAFDYLYKLLLIAVTLPVTASLALIREKFFENIISENISQKSMTRLKVWVATLYFQFKGYELNI